MTAEEISKVLVDLSNENNWPPAAFCVGCLSASLAIIEVAATFHPKDRQYLYSLLYDTIKATEMNQDAVKAELTEGDDGVHDAAAP